MAGKLLAMSKVIEILRLNGLGIKERAIARALRCSRHTVRKLVGEQSEGPSANLVINEEPTSWATSLDWKAIHEEIVKGVPFQVLWEENVEAKRIPVKYNGFA
jgi:hypothetical protein